MPIQEREKMSVSTNIQVPESAWVDYENFVAKEFEEGVISIREGAKMLNITYEAFCEFVSERGIPINEVLSPEERAKEKRVTIEVVLDS